MRPEISQDVLRLNAGATEALRGGEAANAIRLLGEALAIDGAFLPGWLNLATAYRQEGRYEEALRAVRSALTIDPLSFRALLLRANILEAQGDTRSAAQAYSIALTQAPAEAAMDEALKRAVHHAREVYRRFLAELEGFLDREAPPEHFGKSAEVRRMTGFFEHVLGKRRRFHSDPTNFYYPGLPSIEFHDREDFPWLPEVEAATDIIRAELEAVLDDPVSQADLEPYMQRPPEEPVEQWGELNQSLKWSAYHFSIYGEHFAEHRRRCPATAAILDKVGQPDLPKRSPSAMFSVLQPKTHIPPHTGAGNVRLLCHLPLIIPPDCLFRVGSSYRPWIPGEAFVFDDTIEHEAWNNSDQVRTILIFDVWNPLIAPVERDYITRLLTAVDRFVEA